MSGLVVAPPRPFADALASGRFLVTTEEPPPRGADLAPFRSRVEKLRGVVDAVSLTEASSAVLAMSPIGVVPSLLSLGLDPILSITCRDRNRIALQADLLSAAALGVSSVACMAGDPIAGGDHPDATPVFDLDTPSLVRAVNLLNEGRDLAGHVLHGSPSFCCGAVVNPSAPDLEREVDHMAAKVEAGAGFFFTQAVYDAGIFERFMARAERLRVPVLATFVVPRSAVMARRISRSIPGISVPENLIAELERAEHVEATAIALSGRILARLAPACRGLHIITVGWEAKLPEILSAAGIGVER